MPTRYPGLRRSKSRTPKTPRERDHGRRLPHAVRAIERQKEKAGLLAPLMEFETPEERIQRFNASEARGLLTARDRQAAEWRRARSLLRSLPLEERRRAVEAWNAAPYPTSAEYLLGFLGKRDWERPRMSWEPDWATRLWILPCSETRERDTERLPASRRFRSPLYRLLSLVTGQVQGLTAMVVSAERGLLYSWEQAGAADRSMDAARAALLSGGRWREAARQRLYGLLQGSGRPPFEGVCVTGTEDHQAVVRAWDEAGLFGEAPLLYAEGSEDDQLRASAAWLGIDLSPPEPEPGSQVRLF